MWSYWLSSQRRASSWLPKLGGGSPNGVLPACLLRLLGTVLLLPSAECDRHIRCRLSNQLQSLVEYERQPVERALRGIACAALDPADVSLGNPASSRQLCLGKPLCRACVSELESKRDARGECLP